MAELFIYEKVIPYASSYKDTQGNNTWASNLPTCCEILLLLINIWKVKFNYTFIIAKFSKEFQHVHSLIYLDLNVINNFPDWFTRNFFTTTQAGNNNTFNVKLSFMLIFLSKLMNHAVVKDEVQKKNFHRNQLVVDKLLSVLVNNVTCVHLI